MGRDFATEDVIQAAHWLAKMAIEFRVMPAAAAYPGSPTWQHLMFAIGDFERRYREAYPGEVGDIQRYQGVKLDNGGVLLKGERGIILAELVAKCIEIPKACLVAIEIPGDVPPEQVPIIAGQVKHIIDDDEVRVMVLTNGQKLTALRCPECDPVV